MRRFYKIALSYTRKSTKNQPRRGENKPHLDSVFAQEFSPGEYVRSFQRFGMSIAGMGEIVKLGSSERRP
jgi:hypothetical protein